MRRSVAGNTWIYWGLGIVAGVLVVNIIFASYIQNLTERIAAQDGVLRTQEESRDKDTEKELTAAQKQSKLMAQLLANHLYWSQAFALIGDLMQSGVQFTGLAAEAEEGTIEFIATAPSYTSIARQIASFTAGDGVRDIEVSNVKLEGGIAEFTGIITIEMGEVIRSQRTETTP
jgi:hypothetical protein